MDDSYGQIAPRDDENARLRQIVQVFVSVHGTGGLPEELRELAASCAYRLPEAA